jgi:hypothetical protein
MTVFRPPFPTFTPRTPPNRWLRRAPWRPSRNLVTGKSAVSRG